MHSYLLLSRGVDVCPLAFYSIFDAKSSIYTGIELDER